jgi:hypothetical protein
MIPQERLGGSKEIQYPSYERNPAMRIPKNNNKAIIPEISKPIFRFCFADTSFSPSGDGSLPPSGCEACTRSGAKAVLRFLQGSLAGKQRQAAGRTVFHL